MGPVLISELRSLPACLPLARARLGGVFSVTVSRVWVGISSNNECAIRAPGGKARHSFAESRLQVT